MTPAITYSILDTPEEFERATDVEVEVWGLSPRDALAPSVTRAITHAGGVMLGAYDGQEMIGVSFGFPTAQRDRRVLWSHLTGVLKSHQGRGIGEGLKQAQRRWAIEQGFDEMRWTFDPLQRGNANFNLTRLGAVADTYHVNLYGVMTDAINADMPSDRVEAVWDLHIDTPVATQAIDSNIPIALCVDQNGLPQVNNVEGSGSFLVEIPPNLAELKEKDTSAVLEWRLALRQILAKAFEENFIATGFVSVPERQAQAYLLTKLQA